MSSRFSTAGARAPPGLLAVLPGVALAALAFHSGGYFAGATSAAAVALTIVIALRALLAARPFASISGWHLSVGALLTAHAVWVLASGSWSGAPGRAAVDYQRDLLYLLTFALAATLPATSNNRRWLLRGLGIAFLAVGLASLLRRTLPDLLDVAPHTSAPSRSAWPLTYWNGLALLCASGIVTCLHLTATERSRVWAAIAAGGVPLLTTALLLTFSRSAVALSVVLVTAYLLIGRPPFALPALLAVVPATAVAVWATWTSGIASAGPPYGPKLLAEGQELFVILTACAVVAALARTWAIRLPTAGLPTPSRQAIAGGFAAAALVGVVIAVVAVELPTRAELVYERLLETDDGAQGSDPRERLTVLGNNGRLDLWGVALGELAAAPVTGSGAGTYGIAWMRERPYKTAARDAHSLYFENLAELGVVGFALLVVALALALAGMAVRLRAHDRAATAAGFVVAAGWALLAGVDWHWELPAVTLPFFAITGLALGRPGNPGGRRPPAVLRVATVAALALLALLPLSIGRSQLYLDRADSALARGDCAAARPAAVASVRVFDRRPEPFEVLAVCELRTGGRLAPDLLQRALERDPESWDLHLGLAVALAAQGRDPRGALARARRLNPLGDAVEKAQQRLTGDRPAEWRRQAAGLVLPLGGISAWQEEEGIEARGAVQAGQEGDRLSPREPEAPKPADARVREPRASVRPRQEGVRGLCAEQHAGCLSHLLVLRTGHGRDYDHRHHAASLTAKGDLVEHNVQQPPPAGRRPPQHSGSRP